MKRITRWLCSLPFLLPACMSFAQQGHPGSHSHWTYEGPEGPERWGNLDPSYSLCSLGHQQSPFAARKAKTWVPYSLITSRRR